MKLKQLALATLLGPLAMICHADGFTLSGDVGTDFVDSKTPLTGEKLSSDSNPLFGGALGYRYDNGLGVELDYQHVLSFKIKNKLTGVTTNDDDENLGAVDGYYRFNRDGVFQPYLLLGAGWYEFQNTPKIGGEKKENVNTVLGNAGLGAFIKLNDSWSLRGEVRDAHSFGKNTYDDGLVLVGLTYAFGSKPAPAPEPAPVAPTPEPAPVVAPPPPPPAPLDSDDKCPNTPAGVQVDATGCPLDADGDGVPDYLDKCPNTPAGVQVDSTGCPLDSDGDGVPDYLDKCPNTPAGVVVDATGCPKVITEAIKQQINILFDTGKSVIKPEYKSEVEKVATLAKQYPTAYIEIQGYTDSKGNAKKNVKLSQARADAVRASLMKDFAIDPTHVTSKGYGAADPIADNKTEDGRAQNRRVIAVLTATQKAVEMGAPIKHHHHHAKKAAAAPAQ